MNEKLFIALICILVTLVIVQSVILRDLGKKEFEREIVYAIASEQNKRVGNLLITHYVKCGATVSIYENTALNVKEGR